MGDVIRGMRAIGVNVLDDRAEKKGDAILRCAVRRGAKGSRFVSDWYAHVVSKSEENDGIAEILRTFAAEDPTSERIYRGENDLYPEVASSAARYWGTRSAAALRAIENGSYARARRYTQGRGRGERDEQKQQESIRQRNRDQTMLEIQHRGGKTNFIDFTRNKWVALFFACADGPRVGKGSRNTTTRTGRVWRVATSSLPPGTRVIAHDDQGRLATRWERQEGVSIEANHGCIARAILEEMVRIAPGEKDGINSFLATIGIEVETMYNDLEGYIRHDQDFIPIEALCHMAMEQLRNGEHHRVRAIGGGLSARRHDAISVAAGNYLTGLCLAHEGELREAEERIRMFLAAASGDRNWAEANLATIVEAKRRNGGKNYRAKQQRREIGRLRSRLSLEVGDALWLYKLEGYRFRN